MKLVQITQSCLVFLSLSTVSMCHVLVAGNEDAFRSLAKNYVPKALAEKLVNLVSQASEATNVEEEQAADDYTNLRADDQGNEGQVEQEDVNQAQGQQVDQEQHLLTDQGQRQQIEQEQRQQIDQEQREQIDLERRQQIDQYQRQQVDQYQHQQLQEEEAPTYDNREYEFPENNQQEYQVEDREQYEEADGRVNLRVKPEVNAIQPKQMQVNLDELVEKVRERLLDELKTTEAKPANIALDLRSQRPQQRLRPVEQVTEQQIKFKLSTREPKHLFKVTKEKKGVVIETGDLYDKVKLTKSQNKKKDSYEDYAKKLPKKDYDIFETEENNNKPKEGKKGERPFNKPKLKRQENKSNSKSKSTNLPYRNDNNEETNDNINKDSPGNNINTVNKIIPKRTRPTTQNNAINKKPYDMNNEPKINPQTTSEPPKTTTPIEYVDDDLIVASTVETLQKAATEYIGGVDYYKDDTAGPGRTTTTEETVQYPKRKKQIKKKIVTNMPIRLRYTLATPDFYGKLPRMAEKYNFEEPLPEKDREREVPKQIGPPPSNINGNVKV